MAANNKNLSLNSVYATQKTKFSCDEHSTVPIMTIIESLRMFNS